MISTTGNNVDLKFRKKVKFMKDNESGKTREYKKRKYLIALDGETVDGSTELDHIFG